MLVYDSSAGLEIGIGDMTVQESKTFPRGGTDAIQYSPNYDTRFSNYDMVECLEEVLTGLRPCRGIGNRICEIIKVIDSELTVASDAKYRQLLVKAAYALRDLNEWIQKPNPLVPHN